MSTVNLDKPLDDIIASKRKPRNPHPRAPRAPANPAPASARVVVPVLPQGDKIVVSNLPGDVTEAQVKELFATTIGPLKTWSLAFDSLGKSKGVATIQFAKASDAQKAYEQYNKRLVDGKKPMKVEIIIDPSRAPPLPLTSRLGAPPAAAQASSTVSAAGGSARQPRNPAVGGRGGRGGRGRGRGGRRNGDERPKATLESLDQEMSDYLEKGNKTA